MNTTGTRSDKRCGQNLIHLPGKLAGVLPTVRFFLATESRSPATQGGTGRTGKCARPGNKTTDSDTMRLSNLTPLFVAIPLFVATCVTDVSTGQDDSAESKAIQEIQR